MSSKNYMVERLEILREQAIKNYKHPKYWGDRAANKLLIKHVEFLIEAYSSGLVEKRNYAYMGQKII